MPIAQTLYRTFVYSWRYIEVVTTMQAPLCTSVYKGTTGAQGVGWGSILDMCTLIIWCTFRLSLLYPSTWRRAERSYVCLPHQPIMLNHGVRINTLNNFVIQSHKSRECLNRHLESSGVNTRGPQVPGVYYKKFESEGSLVNKWVVQIWSRCVKTPGVQWHLLTIDHANRTGHWIFYLGYSYLL